MPRFQDEVIRCDETVLLESGPGHQVRVSRTPFVARFEEETQRLMAERRSAEEIREALEGLNVGRLRVATKGIDRGDGAGSPLVAGRATNTRQTHGLYMLGQVATLRDRDDDDRRAPPRALPRAAPSCIDREIDGRRCAGETRPTAAAVGHRDHRHVGGLPRRGRASRGSGRTRCAGVDAITEVPPDRWDWRLYYDPDPKAPDKIISKWGGFLPDVAFDPLRYGMPPSSLPSIEPAQLLALEVVRTALADAGYAERPFPREQTAVVLGMGGGAAQLAMGYAFRSYLPMLDTVLPGGGKQAIEACQGLLARVDRGLVPGLPAQRDGGPDRQPA